MTKLNSKTTRGVAALALLAGSLFATNASAEFVSTGCYATTYVRSCVSPGKIGVNTYGTFYLQTNVTNRLRGYTDSSVTAIVRVFTVTGKNVIYQGPISRGLETKPLIGFGAYSTYQVQIFDFKPGHLYDVGQAVIYRN